MKNCLVSIQSSVINGGYLNGISVSDKTGELGGTGKPLTLFLCCTLLKEKGTCCFISQHPHPTCDMVA